MQSIYKLRIQDIIDDIQNGETCVLMKPKGVKMLISSPPAFNIGDKTSKPITTLDLMMSDLYVTPYMHMHKIKSKLLPNEVYEVVHNYDERKIYLTSIREHGVFVNDYRVMQHRADLYDLIMPAIPELDMESLISLIGNPSEQFGALGIDKISNSVMFLNLKYQAILENPHQKPAPPAGEQYTIMVQAITLTRPKSLSEGLNDRFMEILSWMRRASDGFDYNLKKVGSLQHVTTMQDFTMTFLPDELRSSLSESPVNVVLFRTILMMLSGKGYKEGVHITYEQSAAIKNLGENLSWVV